ncbi:hypothetical protein [Candidatus Albibeggiatoa sp. nov. NOAA]|uniref:hypothetical protein n=1 Tax=Candidatus Albibeggiatoa sp. nov. NOAA TaxID=3162724 RepID=UPI0032F496F0|nr:hypothetical protein [Thiotrichaceae bacterium]
MGKKDKLPMLKDVVSKGDETTTQSGLSEVQIQALNEQLEKIINDRVQDAMAQTSQAVVKDIKNYLNKALPILVEALMKKST